MHARCSTSSAILVFFFCLRLAAAAPPPFQDDDDDRYDRQKEAWSYYHDALKKARRGDFRLAYQDITSALERRPDQGEFLLHKGYILLELRYIDLAIETLKHARTAGPEAVREDAAKELDCLGVLEPVDKPSPPAKGARPERWRERREQLRFPKHLDADAHDPHLPRYFEPYPGCCDERGFHNH